MTYDKIFMKEAIKLAIKAGNDGEVPVGAVIVKSGEIVATGMNRREKLKSSVCHAEIEAIETACKKLGGWRLWQCELFVTLEPCPMCAGAIINARIPRVVFGARDPKSGSCGSVINLFDLPYNHKPLLVSGVLQDECSMILTNFFKDIRKKKSNCID